jgi:hypothetical protein
MKNAWPVEAQASGGRTTAATTSTRTSTLLGRVHLPRRHASCSTTAAHGRLPRRVRQLRPRQQGNRRSSPPPSHSPAKCRSTRARRSTRTDLPGPSRSRSRTLPARVGPPDRRRSARTSRTTKSSAGAKASLVTSMGRMAAHTGQVITYDDMLNCEPRVRPGRRQADDGRPGAAPGRRYWVPPEPGT